MSFKFHCILIVCALFWNNEICAIKYSLDLQQEIQDLKKTFHDEISNLKEMFHEEISNLKETFNEELLNLKNVVEKQDAEIIRLKSKNELKHQEATNEIIKNKKRLLLGGASETDRKQIAFYAHLSHDIVKLGVHQPIVFDKVRTNQGNAYKVIDGEFVASVAGTYFFIWTISNADRTYMISEIVVNGVPYGQIISDAAEHTDWAVSTSFTIVSLNVDDRVWIRSGPHHTGNVNGVGYGTSSFAGFILW